MTAGPAPATWLVYAADPMCSWCWGFAPVMRSLVAHLGRRLPLAVVVGGLAPGTTRPMSETEKREIRAHWEQVQALSGQSFDYGFFEREGFVYDTEPACRAVVSAQKLSAGSALAFLETLQGAFYRDDRDITREAVLAELAEEFGLERAGFEQVFAAEDTRRATRAAFELVRKAGITGFPCLLGQQGPAMTVLASGYRPWAELRDSLEAWRREAGAG